MISRENLLTLLNALNAVLGEMDKPAPRQRLSKEQKAFQQFDKSLNTYTKSKKQRP